MKKKIIFLGGSSFLAHCWSEHIEQNSIIFLGVNNKLPESGNYKNIKFDFGSEKDVIAGRILKC